MNWKDAKKQSETAFPLLAPSRVAGIAAIGDVVIISCFEADVAVVLYDDDLSKVATAIAIIDARKQAMKME